MAHFTQSIDFCSKYPSYASPISRMSWLRTFEDLTPHSDPLTLHVRNPDYSPTETITPVPDLPPVTNVSERAVH